MPEIHADRRRRAQELIRAQDADAALITAGPNVRYLTGLASSNAALLLPADGDGALLATDSRYAGAALRDAPDLELVAKAEGSATLPLRRKIEALRMVKDAAEIEKLAVACQLTDAALAEVLPQ